MPAKRKPSLEPLGASKHGCRPSIAVHPRCHSLWEVIGPDSCFGLVDDLIAIISSYIEIHTPNSYYLAIGGAQTQTQTLHRLDVWSSIRTSALHTGSFKTMRWIEECDARLQPVTDAPLQTPIRAMAESDIGLLGLTDRELVSIDRSTGITRAVQSIADGSALAVPRFAPYLTDSDRNDGVHQRLYTAGSGGVLSVGKLKSLSCKPAWAFDPETEIVWIGRWQTRGQQTQILVIARPTKLEIESAANMSEGFTITGLNREGKVLARDAVAAPDADFKLASARFVTVGENSLYFTNSAPRDVSGADATLRPTLWRYQFDSLRGNLYPHTGTEASDARNLTARLQGMDEFCGAPLALMCGPGNWFLIIGRDASSAVQLAMYDAAMDWCCKAGTAAPSQATSIVAADSYASANATD